MSIDHATPTQAWWVFGLSGQLGQAFTQSLHDGDPIVIGISRAPQAPMSGVDWRRGSLDDFADPSAAAGLLASAAAGDATAYLTLAEEMEERDLHYRCEIGKRRLAVTRPRPS